ncbi:hypothetical protein PYH37_002269 [Sinorhizobium numidicum]|uniref:Uncharacterized protein n=1 Tax=Sinorhizobium numidicum TaxID=680248 RepID=A0ABY8D512_9HYPH|nr:hypothetical protein [Sinorhizobium numidicum]WEX77473.1 hypothetical protein PYH37_002269 [Sinorhizobium numidicum]WEX84133.1 hypothetical protein PYH38_002982 [Sinorhizobium numidicum]
MEETLHPAALGHLPAFITAPGETDVLMNVMTVFVVLLIFLIGVLYLRLHALPEHMAYGANKVQLQLVAVLSLIALFTHNHLFWIAALLLALIEFPDFSSPVNSMADSLRRIADRDDRPLETVPAELRMAPAKPQPIETEPQWTPVSPESSASDSLSERRG